MTLNNSLIRAEHGIKNLDEVVSWKPMILTDLVASIC